MSIISIYIIVFDLKQAKLGTPAPEACHKQGITDATFYLADNLRLKVNKSKIQIPNKEQIVKALDALLGVNGTDPHCFYLNIGTHEEEELYEFNSTTVNTIISLLNDLEVAIR
ncbi:hypothetical protein CJP72_12785 [Citrobacter sp. NCU1]|uniref:hypothetical protein n=1 Tax=Citrobacter sp. NCU1 TaxID=2026683 RepID=UPI001390F028|nr:hypothetical protein [Citrobacter sp. NCU1]NDO81607.1 hypothetical protein [Citrobacter sp. NCU1]